MAMEIVISVIILFVGIAILVCIHVCIVGRAFRRDNHGYGDGGGVNQIQSQRQSNSTKRISGEKNIEDLKNLPCFNYKEAEKGSSSVVDCAVCLENFKVGDECRLLPNCSHSFHVRCIDSWILKTPICPICRTWVHSRVTIPRVIREEETQESAVSVSDNAQIEMV